ncbi:MAG: hypothetical protein IKS90_08105 [Clostridia bacterium]|nr:hypothetical protein [Clostridia bacterium]
MFYIDSNKTEYFLITPDEFAEVFGGCSFVITNTGVGDDYTFTKEAELIKRYRELYELLASGKRCDWEEDHQYLNFATGVTEHTDNCVYVKHKTGLRVPEFIEPVVELSVFCAVPFGASPTAKGFFVGQFPQYAFGIYMSFPARITYDDGTEKAFSGLADRDLWKKLQSRIKEIAPTLYIRVDGKKYNTRIRVSEEARKALAGFNAVKESGLELL